MEIIHPYFRALNDRWEARGSDLVINDIDAAIDYDLKHANTVQIGFMLLEEGVKFYCNIRFYEKQP